MIAMFSFKILHNLLSLYTSGPGPSGIAWQHLLEFSRPILRCTPRCSKNKLLTIETQTLRIRSQYGYRKRKIVLFKITGISLEFILIYIFAGLLTILGAVLLAVCINQYRKKGNQTTKRYVGTICFKNSSFPSFQKMQYIPNIPVCVCRPELCSLFWRVRPLEHIRYILNNCSRVHYGEAARRNATSTRIWLSSDT